MPTTMTLDGVHARSPGAALRRFAARLRGPGLGATDPWAGDEPAPRAEGATSQFTAATFGWGVLSFAVSTALIRGWRHFAPARKRG